MSKAYTLLTLGKRAKRFIPLVCVLLAAWPARSQNIISSVAGNGAATFSGDAGLATSAALNSPKGIAIGSNGAIYIADSGNGRIRIVNPLGIISTIGGNGGAGASGDGGQATSASFSDVLGVAVDAAGNIYVADSSNRKVRKISAAGIVTTIAGIGVEAFSGDGGLAVSAALGRPVALTLDAAGNLYIADATNQRIRRIDTRGIITTIAGNGVDAFAGDGGAAASASLGFPLGVAVDKSGNVYVADADNNRIRKISTTGIITTIAGTGSGGFAGDGGLATSATLNIPSDVAVDSAGNIYIADSGNNRIRKINGSGVISTVAGASTNGFTGDGGSPAQANLDHPWGLAIDGADNIYIADRANNRIRLIAPALAGSPSLPANSVLNAASFAANAAISPGAIVAVFGSDFMTGTAAATSTPLPTVLGPDTVKFNGVAAPLYYTSSGQINAQVPFTVPAGTATVQVSRGTATSASQTVSVALASPGIFIVDPAAGTGAIVHAADGTLVTSASPAQAGEFLSIYCTGLGALTTSVQSGSPGPAVPPFAPTVATPVVKIGAASPTVIYSGLAPGFVGLYQINIQVPAGLPSGNQPVQVTISGFASNTATMAVGH